MNRAACKRGLSLDEVFALIEALDVVPVYTPTLLDDKLIRLSESVATDGEGMRGWLVSGLPDLIPPERRPEPPAELTDALAREQRTQENFARIRRVAYGLVDAVRDGVQRRRRQADATGLERPHSRGCAPEGSREGRRHGLGASENRELPPILAPQPWPRRTTRGATRKRLVLAHLVLRPIRADRPARALTDQRNHTLHNARSRTAPSPPGAPAPSPPARLRAPHDAPLVRRLQRGGDGVGWPRRAESDVIQVPQPAPFKIRPGSPPTPYTQSAPLAARHRSRLLHRRQPRRPPLLMTRTRAVLQPPSSLSLRRLGESGADRTQSRTSCSAVRATNGLDGRPRTPAPPARTRTRCHPSAGACR